MATTEKKLIKITYIPNPFEMSDRQVYEVNYSPVAILTLIKMAGIELENPKIIVNSGVVSPDFIPAADDDIFVTANIAGGASSPLLGGVLVVAGIVAQWLPGIGTAVGYGLISLGAGMLVSSLIKPNMPQVQNDFDNSSVYSFSQIDNTVGEGHVVPLVYGRHRVGGTIIESDVLTTNTAKGSSQVLTMVLALSEGPIGGIVSVGGKPEIYINDRPIEYYDDSIYWGCNTGTADQQPLQFNLDRMVREPVNHTLTASGSSYTFPIATNVRQVDFEVHCTLKSVNEIGKKTTMTIYFEYYRDAKWQVSFTQTITPLFNTQQTIIKFANMENIDGSTQARFRMTFNGSGTATVLYVQKHTRALQKSTQIRHQYDFSGVRLMQGKPYTYKLANEDVNKVSVVFHIPMLYKMVNSAMASTDIQMEVYSSADGAAFSYRNGLIYSGATTKSAYKTIDVTLPAGHKYIRINRVTADHDSTDFADSITLATILEIEDAKLNYKNTAVLGLKMSPTDRLSGAAPSITATIDGLMIKNVEMEYLNLPPRLAVSKNPSDIIYDILTSVRYGLGRYILPEQIDIQSLYDYFRWCNERVSYSQYNAVTGATSTISETRYLMNIVFDTPMSALEMLNTICRSTCATIYWCNDKLKVVIDKVKTPSQLFGMSNIVKDSYSETYVSLSDIPNQVEAKYLDETQNYSQQMVSVYDSTRIDEPLNTKTINLYGLTNYSRVRRELMFAMRKARSIKRFISFSVGIDGLMAEVGDVIYFSHDTPQYGYSGKLAGATATGVTLNRTVNLTEGQRYAIIFGDDNVSKHEFVATASGETDSIAIANTTGYGEGTPYAIGAVNKEAIPLRILGIKQTNKYTVELECEEYHQSIYDLRDDVIIDEQDYTSL